VLKIIGHVPRAVLKNVTQILAKNGNLVKNKKMLVKNDNFGGNRIFWSKITAI